MRRAPLLAALALTPTLSAGCGESTQPSDGGGSPGGDECVDFSHFEDPGRERWDLTVIGSGFEADEGQSVRIVVTRGEPSYALAETVIEDGSFEFLLPLSTEPYTGIGVYVDRDADDACDVDGDSLLQITTGGVFGEYTWELTPDELQPSGAEPCNINGIFDLTKSLHCP